MLSILIPVYNTKVTKLVKELHGQCLKAKIMFEILVFDDLSKNSIKQHNAEINGILGVNYVELSSNLGRSKIRNRLAKTASMEYLLFLDADSKIISKKFIKKYIAHLKPNLVINGGRRYSKKAPAAKKKYLHWLYGSKRESQSSKKRNKIPARFFHTNNFAGPSKIISQHPFSESIEGYGYEDILFGHVLEQKGIKILHIDNPVIHNDLEPIDKFLDKQDEALLNLSRITKENPNVPIKIWEAYKKLDQYGIAKMTLKLLGEPSKLKEKLIKSPSLLRLKNYRLAKCIEIFIKKESNS